MNTHHRCRGNAVRCSQLLVKSQTGFATSALEHARFVQLWPRVESASTRDSPRKATQRKARPSRPSRYGHRDGRPKMRPEHVQEGEIIMAPAAVAHCHRHRYHPQPSVACILALAPLQSPALQCQPFPPMGGRSKAIRTLWDSALRGNERAPLSSMRRFLSISHTATHLSAWPHNGPPTSPPRVSRVTRLFAPSPPCCAQMRDCKLLNASFNFTTSSQRQPP